MDNAFFSQPLTPRAILKKGLFTGLLMVTLSACSSSPLGRSQMLLFSDSEMSQMGAQSFEEMKKSEKINTNRRINNYVSCVANALIKQVPKQESFDQWEVVVFDSDQVNAFALPGGKIGVYTGLLKVAKTPDQLAAVVGHEIAHVLAEHGNERMSRSQLTNTGLQITDLALGISGSKYRGATMAALGLGVNLGITLPYGRAQETEADVMGLDIMTKAGFNPKQSIELWKNMAAASRNSPPELLSTHPSHDTRIEELGEQITLLPKYDASKPNCKA